MGGRSVTVTTKEFRAEIKRLDTKIGKRDDQVMSDAQASDDAQQTVIDNHETRIGVLEAAGSSTWVMPMIQLTHTTPTDINALAANNLVPWDATPNSPGNIKDTAVFTHSTTVNPSRIGVLRNGLYRVDVLISYFSAAVRYNGILKLRIDGTTTLDGRGKMGYVRAGSGHNEASLFLTVSCNLTNGQYVEALVDREAVAGAATMSNRQSLFQMTLCEVDL
jgi:hypothetical protein